MSGVLGKEASQATGGMSNCVQLFARGAPIGDGLEGALAFLDLGHDWLVRAFKSLTTLEMHKEWGMQIDV